VEANQTFKVIDGVYVGPKNWEDDLNLCLYNRTIVSLGGLETVGGYLDLYKCTNLISSGKLRKVNKWLRLDYCSNLTTLGNLKTVGWSLFLSGCTGIISLGNLTNVGGSLHLNHNIETPLKEVQDKIKYYSNMVAHEALNAIHTQEVIETPLYKNILTETLQKE